MYVYCILVCCEGVVSLNELRDYDEGNMRKTVHNCLNSTKYSSTHYADLEIIEMQRMVEQGARDTVRI